MSERDLAISEMMDMSYELWERNKDSWSPMEPKYGRNHILWMVEELGEVIAIIKKKREDMIMNDSVVRENFVEELGDVLMYFIDVLNRFHISAEEFSNAYTKKFNKNMKRDYKKQHSEFLSSIK